MNTQEIIDKFKNKYGYVTEIKGVISYLKENGITREQTNKIMFEILKWNLSIDTKNKKTFEETKKHPTSVKEEVKKVETKEEIKSELFDVLSYINSLKECDDDDFLTELLPSIYDSNYDTIISSILLYLLREIQLAHEMMSDDDNDYLTELISKNRNIIKIIEQYNNEEEQTDTVFDERKNKLVFLQKQNGSLFIDDDISDIPDEEDMLPIIKDIENNRITREKRFYNCNPLKGISAIRRRNSRIIFTRLDNDVIVILGILVKRFQNTLPYREMLETRAKIYKLQRDELKDKIHDNSFIEENKEILERIKESLKGKGKYLKPGDNNG